ncbi:transcriptional regulator [Pseudoalteromonas fenneropenaei]|uniref:Transcriptional regulator n=1 Tax=Pseudoalteromonas fenneropenaei TaxID=1737459 RepID=A0ABV7CLB4_9GAMM
MNVIIVGEFKFDAVNACLEKPPEVIALDPRLLALLSFLVANPNRIITRDELQAAIWQQVIVTDNAINKLVANLRKVLADDPKAPRYIKTIPKQGYVFIAPISTYQAESTTSPLAPVLPVNRITQSPHTLRYWLLAAMTIVGFALAYLLMYTTPASVTYGDSQALSRQYGGKGSLLLSADKQTLYFLNHRPAGAELWQLDRQTANQPLPIQLNTPYNIKELLFADKQTLIFRAEEEQCGWYRASFDAISQSLNNDATLLTECDKLTVHRSMLHANGQLYVLAHEKQHEHRNHLYHAALGEALQPLPLELASKWRLIDIDRQATQPQLLLSAHSIDGKTAAVVYDPVNASTSILTELNLLTAPLVWDHQQTGLVFATSAPDSKLIHIDLASQNQTLLASSNERLCCNILRHPNGRDYIFSSNDKNVDLRWQETGYQLDNSSVVDAQPTFAHTRTGHYLLSNRAGFMQVYFQSNAGSAELLPILNADSLASTLALSANDSLLLIAEQHRLMLADLNERRLQHEHFVEGDIINTQWLTNTLFSVSIKHYNQKFVAIYNNSLQHIATLSKPWQQVLADPQDSEHYYFIDSDHNLYHMPTAAIFETPSPDAGTWLGTLPVYDNVKIEHGILYLLTVYGEHLLRYDLRGSQLQHLSKVPIHSYLGFDVKDGEVLFATKASYRSEVYQTLARD